MGRGTAITVKRGRGNPNWGRVQSFVLPTKLSAWEQFVKQEGLADLTPEQLADSTKVRVWARKHYRRRFVPERVLDLLGLDPMDNGVMYWHDLC